MEESVKFSAVLRAAWGSKTSAKATSRSGRLLPAILLVGAALSSSPVATADESAASEERPLLLGGNTSVKKVPVRIDPLLPRGELRWPVDLQEEPRAPFLAASGGQSHQAGQPSVLGSTQQPTQRCSRRRPVCVRAKNEKAVQLALPLLERAFELHHLGAAPPRRGVLASSEPLVWKLDEGPLRLGLTEVPSRGFDRARVRCLGGQGTQAGALQCVAQASVARVAPATAPWLLRGYGELLALDYGEQEPALTSARAAQQHPEKGLLTRSNDGRSWLLLDYLQQRAEHSMASEAPIYALTLAGTRTPPDSLRYEAEPDLMEVLSATVKASRTALARVIDDFAAWRFEPNNLGATLAAPRLAWRVNESSLPRSLALPRPLEPTGSIYLRVDLDAAHHSPEVAFRMYCETPVSYVWSVLRLNAEGRVSGRIPVAYRERQSDTQARIAHQAGTHALVLVGTNLGGIDLAHPFDPDHGPHEAHTCTVAINALDGTNGNSQ